MCLHLREQHRSVGPIGGCTVNCSGRVLAISRECDGTISDWSLGLREQTFDHHPVALIGRLNPLRAPCFGVMCDSVTIVPLLPLQVLHSKVLSSSSLHRVQSR